MKSQVLPTVWCNVSGEAAREIWRVIGFMAQFFTTAPEHLTYFGCEGFSFPAVWHVVDDGHDLFHELLRVPHQLLTTDEIRAANCDQRVVSVTENPALATNVFIILESDLKTRGCLVFTVASISMVVLNLHQKSSICASGFDKQLQGRTTAVSWRLGVNDAFVNIWPWKGKTSLHYSENIYKNRSDKMFTELVAQGLKGQVWS